MGERSTEFHMESLDHNSVGARVADSHYNGVIDPSQDAQRLTPLSKKLRSKSLDKLPEPFNTPKKGMTVVRSKLLLVQYLKRYNEHQACRHEVQLGFAGSRKPMVEIRYLGEKGSIGMLSMLEHILFIREWNIVFIRIKIVICKEGILSVTGKNTMIEFRGSAEK